MLADLEIELVENSLAQRHRSWVAVYPRNTGDADQIAFATLKALVHHPDLFAEALYRRECDDLLDVAEAVARVRTIAREMDNDEALPELTRMRDSSQPEWLRTLAGRELSRRGAMPKVARIDIAEDDRAVCDASSVDEGLEVIGATRTVWWEGVDVFSTPEATGKLYAVERDNRTCPLYRIRLDDGRATTGNQIKIPEATP